MLAPITALLAMAPGSGASCPAADPAITKVSTSHAATGDGLNTYTLNVTVANIGSAGQPGNTLQSVAIYLDGQKKDVKGLPPLRAGQTYSFPYVVHRSADAAAGTTSVRFQLVRIAPAEANCPGTNDTMRVVI
jgi:hypothetical protein